jgi:hypothetical protein
MSSSEIQLEIANSTIAALKSVIADLQREIVELRSSNVPTDVLPVVHQQG